MQIRAAKPERTQAGSSRTGCALPRNALRRNFEAWLPSDVGIDAIQIEVRHDCPMFQHQDGFDEPGDSGCGFEMSDVCFDGSDADSILRCTFGPVDTVKGIALDRVSELGPGAMRFDIG